MAGEERKGGIPLVMVPRATAIDPVCGMTVDPATAAGSYTYGDQTYYFCNPRCLERFKANPEQYLKKSTPSAQAAPSSGQTSSKTDYTCPMDPEIHADHPGPCPKCGMALETLSVAAPVTRTEYVCPMHPEIVR